MDFNRHIETFLNPDDPSLLCSCRESIYRLLPQTTPENIAKNFDQYTIDPTTRYPNLNSSSVRPQQVRAATPSSRSSFLFFFLFPPSLRRTLDASNPQVRHLYVREGLSSCTLERAATIRRPVNLSRRGECGGNFLPSAERIPGADAVRFVTADQLKLPVERSSRGLRLPFLFRSFLQKRKA